MKGRRWSKLPFYDPRGLLIELAKLSDEVAAASLPYNLASLRTNELKTYREARQCALFCYGHGPRLGLDVRFAFPDEQDVDVVARFERHVYVNFVHLTLTDP